MVYVTCENLKLCPFYDHKKVRTGVNSVKPAHLNLIPASDEDTIGRFATRTTILDHNMVYVPGKNFKLRPFYAHQRGATRCNEFQTSPSTR